MSRLCEVSVSSNTTSVTHRCAKRVLPEMINVTIRRLLKPESASSYLHPRTTRMSISPPKSFLERRWEFVSRPLSMQTLFQLLKLLKRLRLPLCGIDMKSHSEGQTILSLHFLEKNPPAAFHGPDLCAALSQTRST